MVVHSPLDRRAQPLHQGNFSGLGNLQPLAHVSHHLVEQKHHRRAEGLGNVEGLHGHGEDVLVVRGRQAHDAVVPVGAPARLHHVPLAHVVWAPRWKDRRAAR